MTKTVRPYGLWSSPITPEYLSHGKRLTEVAWDTDGHTLVWLEERSERGVLVCSNDEGQAHRELTNTLSVRAKVGYGGGEFTVGHGHVYFAEQSGRLYRQSITSGKAKPLLAAFGHAASPCLSPDGTWLVYIHSYEGSDVLAIIDSEGTQWPQKLSSGADFYMQPCWHPSGRWLSWIEWDHPQMPWDGTRLMLAQIVAGSGQLPRLLEPSTIAGDTNTGIFQPTFSPDGISIAYISDQNGWSNLWIYDVTHREHRCLIEEPVELGVPAWTQGRRTFGFSHDGRHIYFLRNERGRWRPNILEIAGGKTSNLTALSDYESFGQLAVSPTKPAIAFIASAGTTPPRVLTYTSDAEIKIRVRATDETLVAECLARPEPIEWASASGETIHGIYYPPTNPAFDGRDLPPAIIQIHGGPTGQRDCSFSPANQFFATRGYVVLEVNYRGSTGYGKSYRQALNGKWGIYDVEDAVSGAQHLVDSGLAHPERLVIMGGSAGGYTVLRALTTHPGFFKAGICLYGISNLFTLDAETHKFESHYLESLLGPLPESSAVYRERSPLFAVDKIRDPVAIFQGEDDKVVPKDQAELLVNALKQHGVPYEYHLYEGEGHGWRKAETVTKFYTAVEAFLRQYVVFS
ncbi:MAG TPA: S9 family peptidase [Nitrospirales bacterium]|nr:S9 family peptidase [Nitrospirales bacterium]